MEINELQIGDWVYSTFTLSKLPCKVTYLRLHESGYGSVETTNIIGVKDITSLSPILLTPEILEKNGFERAPQVSDIEPFDTDEEGNKHYSYNKTFWGWLQPDNIFCIPANGMGWLYLKYVHQLQHALRLYGISKEITF